MEKAIIWRIFEADVSSLKQELSHDVSVIIKKYFFLTRALSLINTCCWRTDYEILIHDGASRNELIFVSARQHVLISNNLPVGSYFDSNIL